MRRNSEVRSVEIEELEVVWLRKYKIKGKGSGGMKLKYPKRGKERSGR